MQPEAILNKLGVVAQAAKVSRQTHRPPLLYPLRFFFVINA